MTDDTLTTEETANALGYSLRHVQRMLRQRRLQGTKFGRLWQVSRSEVERVLAIQKRSASGRFFSAREDVDK